MSYHQAIILAVIQALTEFLPISSSAHLVVFQKLFGFSKPPVVFDILVHLGALGAVVFHLRGRLVQMMKGLRQRDRESLRVFRAVIIGSIPAVLIGLFLQRYIGQLFDSLRLVGISLLITSGLLFSTKWVDKKSKGCKFRTHCHSALDAESIQISRGSISIDSRFRGNDTCGISGSVSNKDETCRGLKGLKDLSWLDALFVGLFQALAILPGVSRSGSTIVAGLWRQFDRETAFHFSFYLAIPAIIGATVLQIPELVGGEFNYLNQAFLGMIIAGIVGYLALIVLKRILFEKKLWLFGFYCLFLGLLLLLFP